ncbi:MAG TPA: hypothetical protein VE172_00920 [Stackebrandtia sp.]|uniref:hypothetical protein n=1 Tax=Stackebrandtia sp. TaxID=2023065 RepID=UPI002D3ECFE2|nr:hypothetical protein [Stackebrandtia sp.]HZE37352.1 hypothetical protein [Stackebrandtia sp.]
MAAAEKNRITFGKFHNVDMRVARVVSARLVEDLDAPCRVVELDLGELGRRTSVGQYALVDEGELVGRNIVVCANLAPREMGPYVSEVLMLGAPHPDSPEGQSQATPLFVGDKATPGDLIY